MSEHLNFDTDFLNNAKATSKPKVNSPKQSGGSGGLPNLRSRAVHIIQGKQNHSAASLNEFR